MAAESRVQAPPRVSVIGVPITAVDLEGCVRFVEENLDAIRGSYLCLSNAHTTVMAHDDPAYFEVQAGSLMSLPDGKPLSVVGCRSEPSMGRVTGPDLLRALLERSKSHGWSHYFYGNTPENLQRLEVTLGRDYPQARIAGLEPSVFRELSDEEVGELAGRVDASGADFLWVGIGAPQQETLCARLKGNAHCLMAGVGGAFNILAGVTPGAPGWMQRVGLEWLYRLSQEPRRLFRRYAVTNTKFVFYALTGKRRKS